MKDLYFKFLKIPIYIDLSFWLFLLILVSPIGGVSFLLVTVLIVSMLLHEYGHAWVALYFRADPIIILQAFGGRTAFNTAILTAKQKFLITLAGPLLQGLVVGATYLLKYCTILDSYYTLLWLVMYINIMLLIMNIMPIIPFDGGWLVRYSLEQAFGHKGYLASIVIGLIAAVIAIPCLLFYGAYIFWVVQLLIAGLHYCQLWQKEQQR